MSRPSSVRTHHTFRPGEVWTASGRFAVDAVRARIVWHLPDGDGAPVAQRVLITEVHELNISGRRHNRHTGVSLRRSVDQFRREGITFYAQKRLHTILPPFVHVSPNFHVRAFVTDTDEYGPFDAQDPSNP